MNTKYLMISSAIATGLGGLIASFLPSEILTAMGENATAFTTLMVQIMGALYLGFAAMNWMAKSVLIGGIYAKPLCMGNCLHFFVAAMGLVKFSINNPGSWYLWTVTILYSIFAILFARVLFTNPKKVMTKTL